MRSAKPLCFGFMLFVFYVTKFLWVVLFISPFEEKEDDECMCVQASDNEAPLCHFVCLERKILVCNAGEYNKGPPVPGNIVPSTSFNIGVAMDS